MNKMFNDTDPVEFLSYTFLPTPPPKSPPPPPQKKKHNNQALLKSHGFLIPNHSSGVGESVATARPLAQHWL